MIAQVTSQSASGSTDGTSSTPQPRLVNAAHEFEAQLMKELLKPVGESFSASGDDGDGDSESGGVLGEYATESLARAISNQGGLGIANQIIHSLSTNGNPSVR